MWIHLTMILLPLLMVAPCTAEGPLVFQSEMGAQPGQPCCFPTCDTHAWLLFGLLGKGQPSTAFSSPASVSFDNENYLAAVHGIGTAQDPLANMSVVVDYTAGVMYVAQTESKQCKQVQLPEGMSGTCIPDDADYTYQGRTNLGYGGKMTLAVDNYYVDGNQAGVNLQFQAGVTPDHCGPVSLAVWGDTGNAQVITQLNFFNTTAGIRDKNVFSVPSYCRREAAIGAAQNGRPIPPVLDALKQIFLAMRRRSSYIKLD